MREEKAIKEISLELIKIAKEQGDKFRAENKRDPTQAEAERILAMIKRQFDTVLILTRR